MTAKNYALLAAIIFTVVALVQLSRATSVGFQVIVGSYAITFPIWASWIVAVVAGVLAWLGFNAARS
jgi:hypothetical protein